ncbi:hypothetical protein BT96DRAFT_332169 [Gymnopus androsaceus JB14]|uniref:Family A G protein-coupled receptor-like protein n=1 Tax=Gymnopus androsaceus JB14 TaxID=1447944 RepID=A0A6A4GYJ5_9AGAR|nr:hypothetical protein BT96DRAFT_332169 [Gymnopus androsaceus JB14]
MSPEESELLASVGVSLYWDTAQVILDMSLFGFYVLITIISLHLLFKTGIKGSRPRQVLLGLTILVFFVNIWAFINEAAVNLIRPKYIFMPLGNLVEQIDLAASKSLRPWSLVPTALFNVFVGDATVIWRAYTIYGSNRKVQLALVLLMIINGVAIITDVTWTQVTITSVAAESSLVHESLETVCYWTSPLVNLVVLVAIGTKLRNHHRFIQPLYGKNSHKRSQVERLLLFLVESGTVICILQLVFAVLLTLDLFTIVNEGTLTAFMLVNSLYIGVAPMYLQAVIILVNIDRAPLEQTFHIDINGATTNEHGRIAVQHEPDVIDVSQPADPTATQAVPTTTAAVGHSTPVSFQTQ